MNDLLTIILKNITTKPEGVNIAMEMEGDVEVYTIKVDAEDVGRVIGKSGKIIRAIRSLAHVSAVHNQKRVRIHLDDGSPQDQAAPQTTIDSAAAETPAPVEAPVVDAALAPEDTAEPVEMPEVTPVEAVATPEVEVEVPAVEEVQVEAPAETPVEVAPVVEETPVEVAPPAVEDLLPSEEA